MMLPSREKFEAKYAKISPKQTDKKISQPNKQTHTKPPNKTQPPTTL